MKPTWRTTDRIWPDAVRGLALAECGELKAFLWEKDGECQIHIYREDPESGETEHGFRPCDVECLAGLMAVVAEALTQVATIPDSLNVQLATLAGCLGQALGVSTGNQGRPVNEAMQ